MNVAGQSENTIPLHTRGSGNWSGIFQVGLLLSSHPKSLLLVARRGTRQAPSSTCRFCHLDVVTWFSGIERRSRQRPGTEYLTSLEECSAFVFCLREVIRTEYRNIVFTGIRFTKQVKSQPFSTFNIELSSKNTVCLKRDERRLHIGL